MSKVNLSKIDYPYVNIYLKEGQAEKIGINLKNVYLYIDEHINMGRRFTYGNAYKYIKIKANVLLSRNDIKIKKKEVSALIKFKPEIDILGRKKYIKIPYKMSYVFEAIFLIVDELKVEYPLPADLEIFIDSIRRESFYDIQSSLYKEWYKGNENELTKGLYDDMFACDSVLSKNF